MKLKSILLTAAATISFATATMAQVPTWTGIGPVDDYKNIIQLTNGNFVSSANNDVYVFQNTTSTFTALNFNSQIGSLCISQLLGENSAGSIFRASCHNGIYQYSNGNWTLNGLSGFGTGGQYWNNLSSGRLIMSKGGFLRNIYYSDNDGSNWISAGLGDVDWNFLVVSQNQSLFAVSCCGGVGQKGLIKSTDNGTSWSYLNSSVPLSTARCIANDLNGALYVIADDFNIKNSSDDGNTWSQFSTTPNNEIGYNLLFSQDAMFLFTASGPVSKIYYSPLNTINWQDISSSFPANSSFNEMKYLDGKVFVCTNNGLFFANTVNCANNTTITPQINSLTTGSPTTFTATTSDPNPSYVWQSDFGQGYVTLNNYGSYSGVNSATLNIANVQLSEHNQPIRVISTSGNCIDTSNVAVISILDTCLATVYDTLLTTVTDTLVINTQITGINPPNNLNTLKVYPNPASTHITIDYGNFNAMSGYTLTIVNSVGQTVFTTPINQQTSYIDLSTWTGNGIYFVQIIDPQNNTIENRKIVIQ